MVSNFMWMFCEGLYLHTLLAFAFISESRILRYFFVLGWGLPLVIVPIYTVLRALDDQANV